MAVRGEQATPGKATIRWIKEAVGRTERGVFERKMKRRFFFLILVEEMVF